MEIEILAEHIIPFISIFSKIIPLHAPLPILSNILLSADSTHFSLSATNLELGVQAKIPAKIITEGAITVPGRQFIEVLNSLPKGKIHIKLKEDTVILSSGGNTVKFQTIPKDEFPTLFDEKGDKVYSFSMEEFKNIFSHLTFVASIDEARPTLHGVYMTQKDEGVNYVATDGFRMALIKKTGTIFEQGKGIIIASRLLNEVLTFKEQNTIDMYLYEAGNQVVFETEHMVFVGRVIDGVFPNYQKVIPQSSKTIVVFDREDFLQAVKLAGVFAKESANIVHLKIEGNTIKFYSKSSGVGEGEVTIDVEKTGEDNEIAFNIKFLNDLLRSIEDKRIIMELNSGLESSVFKRENNEEFLHIIMPVRVTE